MFQLTRRFLEIRRREEKNLILEEILGNFITKHVAFVSFLLLLFVHHNNYIITFCQEKVLIAIHHHLSAALSLHSTVVATTATV